jgi:hypothetical protein
MIASRKATCQSGYGAVCKTVYPGSIPGVASIAARPLAINAASSTRAVSNEHFALKSQQQYLLFFL